MEAVFGRVFFLEKLMIPIQLIEQQFHDPDTIYITTMLAFTNQLYRLPLVEPILPLLLDA